MKGGYETMVWIRDKDGKEYACYADDLKCVECYRREIKVFSPLPN